MFTPPKPPTDQTLNLAQSLGTALTQFAGSGLDSVVLAKSTGVIGELKARQAQSKQKASRRTPPTAPVPSFNEVYSIFSRYYEQYGEKIFSQDLCPNNEEPDLTFRTLTLRFAEEIQSQQCETQATLALVDPKRYLALIQRHTTQAPPQQESNVVHQEPSNWCYAGTTVTFAVAFLIMACVMAINESQ